MERSYFPSQLIPQDVPDEGIDEFNDDTFGGEEPLTDEWEFSHKHQAEALEKLRSLPPSQLPSFFEDQQGEDFEEEPLEPLGQESLGDFPTARRNVDENEDFFFLDTETEANAQLDSQMESMFTLVLDDEEDVGQKQRQISRNPPPGSSSVPISIQGLQQANSAGAYGDFSPLSKEASIWSAKSPMGSPATTTEGKWSASSPYRHPDHQEAHRGYAQPEPRREQESEGSNPLTKFFGSAIVNQGNLPPPKMAAPGGKVLSVEELEAKLRGTAQPQSAPPRQQLPPGMLPQQPGMMHPGQPPMVQQPVPRQQHPQQPGIHPQQHPQQPHHQQPGIHPQQHKQAPQQRPPMPQQMTPQEAQQADSIFNQESFPALSAQQQAQKQQKLTGPHPSNRGGFQAHLAQKETQSPNRSSYRPRWRENKSMMTAEEIDSIIRMQEAQLNNTGSNPFAEDYYFLIRKQRLETADLSVHKPLFESSLRPTVARKPGADPLEGVLGRIPSHSVRAPRPLLQLKQHEGLLPLGVIENTPMSNLPTSSKIIQSLLLTIENTFSFLLDIEDIDSILKNGASANHFNIQHLRSKREELTLELFKSMHVYVPPHSNLPQRKDGGTFIYPEDDIFMNLTLVKKGKKLVTRALPILFQNQVFAIFFVYMRNLALLVTSSRLEMDVDSTNKLFGYLLNMINNGSVPQSILSFQTILTAHMNDHLIKVLQSKFGLSIMQSILKRGHDLNMSPCSRDEQFSPPGSAGFHWKETIQSFLQRMNSNFNLLFDSEIGRTSKIWEFFAVLVVNINQEQKKLLLTELGPRIKTTQMNPTLAAFLQLSGQSLGQ